MKWEVYQRVEQEKSERCKRAEHVDFFSWTVLPGPSFSGGSHDGHNCEEERKSP